MDARRIPVGSDTTTVTVAQVSDLTRRLHHPRIPAQPGSDHTAAAIPTFVFDAGYDPIALTHELGDLAATIVVRIRDDRVFYTDPAPTEPGTVGRPRRHGHRFSCANPPTWPAPDTELHAKDRRYGTVHVHAWRGLHPKLAGRGRWTHHDAPPIVTGTVIRVDVEHLPKPTTRTKRTLWLWAAGPGPIHLYPCWRAYLRRFDIEHTFRFCKNTLGWTTPRTCAPHERPTGGPGSSPPPTPNFGSPDPWSPTSDCPGKNPPSQANSPPRVSGAGFDDLPQHWAHRPTHQNPAKQAPDAPKEPAAAPEPATPPLGKPPNTACPSLIAS